MFMSLLRVLFFCPQLVSVGIDERKVMTNVSNPVLKRLLLAVLSVTNHTWFHLIFN